MSGLRRTMREWLSFKLHWGWRAQRREIVDDDGRVIALSIGRRRRQRAGKLRTKRPES